MTVMTGHARIDSSVSRQQPSHRFTELATDVPNIYFGSPLLAKGRQPIGDVPVETHTGTCRYGTQSSRALVRELLMKISVVVSLAQLIRLLSFCLSITSNS